MLPRRLAIALRWLAAAMLFASAFAHALGGWPQFVGELAARGVDAAATGALQIGWYWGSVAFLAFALVAALAARARPEEDRLARGALLAVGAPMVGFGIAAMVARHGNPHFLLFVALGLVLAASASTRR
ncbi:MAG: hypothetical protein KDB94_10140 [Acidobacteria bacterium]|nr:hypothetical protein [Acidobacteriota bacterium]MCB9377332.1 hypothetical protein [Holophagales bacterium]